MPSHRARKTWQRAHSVWPSTKDRRIVKVTLRTEQWTYKKNCTRCDRYEIVRYWSGTYPYCEPCGEYLVTVQGLDKVVNG